MRAPIVSKLSRVIVKPISSKIFDFSKAVFLVVTLPIYTPYLALKALVEAAWFSANNPRKAMKNTGGWVKNLFVNPIGTMKDALERLPDKLKWVLAYFFTLGKSIPSAGLAYFSYVRTLVTFPLAFLKNGGANYLGIYEIICNFIVCWKTRGRKIREYFGMGKKTMNSFLAFLEQHGWVNTADKKGESDSDKIHIIDVILRQFDGDFYQQLADEKGELFRMIDLKYPNELGDDVVDTSKGDNGCVTVVHHGTPEEYSNFGASWTGEEEEVMEEEETEYEVDQISRVVVEGVADVGLPNEIPGDPQKTIGGAIKRIFGLHKDNEPEAKLADDNDFELVRLWQRMAFQYQARLHRTPLCELIPQLEAELKKKFKHRDSEFFENHGWSVNEFCADIQSVSQSQSQGQGASYGSDGLSIFIDNEDGDSCAGMNCDAGVTSMLPAPAEGRINDDTLSDDSLLKMVLGYKDVCSTANKQLDVDAKKYVAQCRCDCFRNNPHELISSLIAELNKSGKKRNRNFFKENGLFLDEFVRRLDADILRQFHERNREEIAKLKGKDKERERLIDDVDGNAQYVNDIRGLLRKAIDNRSENKKLTALLKSLFVHYQEKLKKKQNIMSIKDVESGEDINAEEDSFNDLIGDFVRESKERMKPTVNVSWFRKWLDKLAVGKSGGAQKEGSISVVLGDEDDLESDDLNDSAQINRDRVLALLDALFARTGDAFFKEFRERNKELFANCPYAEIELSPEVIASITKNGVLNVKDQKAKRKVKGTKERLREAFEHALEKDDISLNDALLVRLLRSSYKGIHVEKTPLKDLLEKMQEKLNKAEHDTSVKKIKNMKWLKVLTTIIVVMGIGASLAAGLTAYLGAATVLELSESWPSWISWLSNVYFVEGGGLISSVSSFLAFATFQVDAIPGNLAEFVYAFTAKGRKEVPWYKTLISVVFGIWITATIGFRTKFELTNAFAKVLKRFGVVKLDSTSTLGRLITSLIYIGTICNVVATFGAQVTKFMTTKLSSYLSVFKDLPKKPWNKAWLFFIAFIGFSDSFNYSAGCPISTKDAVDDMLPMFKSSLAATIIYYISGFFAAFTTSIAFTWFQNLMVRLKESLATAEAEAEENKKRYQEDVLRNTHRATPNRDNDTIKSPFSSAPSTMGPGNGFQGGMFRGDSSSTSSSDDGAGLEASVERRSTGTNKSMLVRFGSWCCSWFVDDISNDEQESLQDAKLPIADSGCKRATAIADGQEGNGELAAIGTFAGVSRTLGDNSKPVVAVEPVVDQTSESHAGDPKRTDASETSLGLEPLKIKGLQLRSDFFANCHVNVDMSDGPDSMPGLVAVV